MKIRTISAVLVAILLLACGGARGWFYFTKHFSVPVPLQQSQRTPSRPAIAAIVLAAPPNMAQSTVSNQPPSAEPGRPPHPSFTLQWDALDEFHHDTANSLVSEFGSSFPDLKTTLNDGGDEANNATFAHTTLQLLEAIDSAAPEKKPALFLAADLAASHVWCNVNRVSPTLAKSTCPDAEASFAKHGIALHYDELGGGFFYRRDLLWRLWEKYPDSLFGERAFVMLLESGWDTSGTCEKGDDQTQVVIRRGEEFLQKHPASLYRADVNYLIAEAYASWWSLSQEGPAAGLVDYVDPGRFQEGAGMARRKAIEYFDRVPALAPGTKFETYAQAAAESLRKWKVLEDPRFFCVHD